MRVSILILLLVYFQTLLAEDQWSKTKQGCAVWNDAPQPHEISTWTGQCVDGLVSGYGVLTWKFNRDGKTLTERYEGEMRNGKEHGRGTYTSADGGRYDGDWIDGKVHGRGIYIHPSDGTYEGEFREGKYYCYGIRTHKDGIRFEGQFIEGNKHDIGQCRDLDGRWGVCEYSYGVFLGWR